MAITRVQAVHSENAASATTISQALTTAAGSLVVVIAICHNDQTITSVADDLAVAGTAATANQGPFNTNPNNRGRIFYFPNYGGGSRTFTATFNAASANRCIVILEYAGALTSSPQDGAGVGTAAEGSNADAGAIIPSVNGALLVTYCINYSAPTANAPFGDILSATVDAINGRLVVSDYVQPTAASIHPTWTNTPNQFWLAQVAAFKPAASGGGALGTATITALCEGVSGTALITVTA